MERDPGLLQCARVTAGAKRIGRGERGVSERAERAMTIEGFLVWQLRQDIRYELVDGQPVAMTGARLRHDRATVNALTEISRQLRANGSPCDTFTADIGIRTPLGNLRRPDVSVLCPPFDEEAMVSDRPSLIVEVLSESTAGLDGLIKLEEYKAIESLDAIIMIDPTRMEVGLWTRDSGRAWHAVRVTDPEAALAVPSLGLSIDLAALYDRVPVTSRLRPRLVWEDDGA
jgi:Uma2 family endonuclease